MRIAQRFHAGLSEEGARVPEGQQRPEIETQFSVVPPGLCQAPTTRPSVKTLGYCRMSLRDGLPPEFQNGIRVTDWAAGGSEAVRLAEVSRGNPRAMARARWDRGRGFR